MTAEDYLEAQHKLHVEQEMAHEREKEQADQDEAERLYNLREVWAEQILKECEKIESKQSSLKQKIL